MLIAPDSYKESLSAVHVAEEIEGEAFPRAEYTKLPMADAGERTANAGWAPAAEAAQPANPSTVIPARS
jgi:glycerate kinase